MCGNLIKKYHCVKHKKAFVSKIHVFKTDQFRTMLEKIGYDYSDYKSNVRRWLGLSMGALNDARVYK